MDAKGLPDTELVARARGGDLDAFDRLAARHRARVLDIAREITSDREAAQDIAQEALLRAFRALGALRDRERFGVWLNTITRRLGQEWLRNGGRRPEPMEDVMLRGAPVVWASPPEPNAELAVRIREGLSVLSERERRAMILHYLEGRSCEEIAAQLGITTGSVKRILHYSRRKVRKECEEMAEAEKGRKGPRKLGVWVDGFPGRGRNNIIYHLWTSLPQTICLAVNKRPKTAAQIADEAGTHPTYVQETVDDLLEMEVLASPKKEQYLANFIAFDAEDWRRLMRLVPEPAGEVAKRLSEAQPRLQAVWEKTPLAQRGWAWRDVMWPVYVTLVANTGASRAEPEAFRPPKPDRPGGGRYWLGGHEWVPDLPQMWGGMSFSCSTGPQGLSNGYWRARQSERDDPPVLQPMSDQARVIEALADGPLTEVALLGRLDGDGERWRSVLAELVEIGYVAREGERYRLTIPVFTRGDSDVLTPEMDAVVKPIVDEVVVPALSGIGKLLDEMGYAHRRDQYGQWSRWVAGSVMGEGVRFLMEQGVLPPIPDPIPHSFAFIAWRGDLPLMDWGVW